MFTVMQTAFYLLCYVVTFLVWPVYFVVLFLIA
jgi:hypothetical protein